MAKTYLENQVWGSMGGVMTDYDEAYKTFAEGLKKSLEKRGIDPNAIQPMDETFDCCLCGKHIENEYSHNAEPLVEEGRCCIECNALKVMPARLKDMGLIK